jgi:hypothetical protein
MSGLIQIDRFEECLKNKLNEKHQTEKSKSRIKKMDQEWKTKLFKMIYTAIDLIHEEWKIKYTAAGGQDTDAVAKMMETENAGFKSLQNIFSEL